MDAGTFATMVRMAEAPSLNNGKQHLYTHV
jgi:hypothetical protein